VVPEDGTANNTGREGIRRQRRLKVVPKDGTDSNEKAREYCAGELR
jgi:hypothetical protein